MSANSPTDEPAADHAHPGGQDVAWSTGAADALPPSNGGDGPPGLLDDPTVTAAIETHADAEVALVEAKHELTRAREEVRNALFAAGKRYRDRDLALPRSDLHRLYWEHRELRVSDVANALALSSVELARLAGPAEGHGRCDDCEQVVPMLLDTRTPKPGYGRVVRCGPCQDRHDAREERERQRQHELDLARIAAGDALPERDVVRLDGRSGYRGPGW